MSGSDQMIAVTIAAEPPRAVVHIKVTTDTDGLASREWVEKRIGELDASGGVAFEVDETLTLRDGVLSVNTTDAMEQDNTLPITSAGVYATVGNINALLATI